MCGGIVQDVPSGEGAARDEGREVWSVLSLDFCCALEARDKKRKKNISCRCDRDWKIE